MLKADAVDIATAPTTTLIDTKARFFVMLLRSNLMGDKLPLCKRERKDDV